MEDSYCCRERKLMKEIIFAKYKSVEVRRLV
jgi:hypothetical protein